MKTRLRLAAATSRIDLDSPFVERTGPGKAPTAFRIWAAGPNMTDDGPAVFSERSATLLMEEQATRGNLYSIDYDHLSLKEDRPATAGQAAGWFRVEVRKGASGGSTELWATSVEWCEEARSGLESDPPKWRYFSPAYRQEETGEVVSLINLALCINPKTWSNTQLAARSVSRRASMDEEKMKEMAQRLMAFKAMAEDPDGDKDLKEKAKDLYESCVAAMGGAEKAEAAMKALAEEDPAPDSEKKEPKADAEEAPPSSKPVPPKGDKRATRSNSEVELATRVAELEARLEAAQVTRLVEANLGKKIPESLKGWALKQKMDTLGDFLKSAPVISAAPTKVKTETATRGENQGEASVSEDSTAKHIDKVLGRRTAAPTVIGMDARSLTAEGLVKVNMVTPTEYRRMSAEKK